MTGGNELLIFPDDAQMREEKRKREREMQRQAEEKLQSTALDLLNRWDELRVEVIGSEGTAHALGATTTQTTSGGDSKPGSAEAAAHIRAATRAVPDAIITFTADGRIRSFNAGAERMFGYRTDEALQHNIYTLLPSAPELIEQLAAAELAGEHAPSSIEGIGITQQGAAIEVEISVGVTEIEDIRYHAAVVRDISERTRVRRELERLNRSLHEQVLETDAALNRLHEAQTQLVQAEKMASLGLLVAGVAHEINTPIGIAVTAASFLGDQANGVAAALKAGGLKKSQLEAAVTAFSDSSEMILSNLQRAAALVQSFKQVAVDQGSAEWRQIELAEYLAEVMLSLQPRIKMTPHHLEIDCPSGLMLYTAPGAIAQILTNLVMNSLIHAWDEGQTGLMQLSVRAVGQQLEISYRDDGRGLSTETLPLIFDPFYTTRRGDGGSGLGLHIVFNLVSQTLRGRILASSQLGQGLRFEITIPIQQEDANTATDRVNPSS